MLNSNLSSLMIAEHRRDLLDAAERSRLALSAREGLRRAGSSQQAVRRHFGSHTRGARPAPTARQA